MFVTKQLIETLIDPPRQVQRFGFRIPTRIVLDREEIQSYIRLGGRNITWEESKKRFNQYILYFKEFDKYLKQLNVICEYRLDRLVKSLEIIVIGSKRKLKQTGNGII